VSAGTPTAERDARRLGRRGSVGPTRKALLGVSALWGLPADREAEGKQGMSHWSLDLVVDQIAYEGRGVCAVQLPQRTELHRWGYPLQVTATPNAPMGHAPHLADWTW
jgi:hypothetical protein